VADALTAEIREAEKKERMHESADGTGKTKKAIGEP
jgi:hypothetical protein